jgi:hypothetical protein
MVAVNIEDLNLEVYCDDFPGVLGNIKRKTDYMGRTYVHAPKEALEVTSNFLRMSFGELVSCMRHIPAQILPAIGWAFECTGTLAGLTNTLEGMVNASDFVEFVNDINFWVNGDAAKVYAKSAWIEMSACVCGTMANVTNTVELLRIWGMASFAFLGDAATTIGSFTIYGSYFEEGVRPFAVIADWTVSGVCTTTLVFCYIFLNIKANNEFYLGKENIESLKKISQVDLESKLKEYRAAKVKKLERDGDTFHAEKKIAKYIIKDHNITPEQLGRFKDKKLTELAKNTEIERLSWYSSAAKGSLYITLFGLGWTQVPLLGALGLLATVTTSRVWYYKHYGEVDLAAI